MNGDAGPGASAALLCPYCTEPVEPAPPGREWVRCRACGSDVNTAAQEALARAEREIERANRGALAVSLQFHGTSMAEPDVLQAYQRAYSAVQTALQEDLPEARREAAITLMAGLSRYLARYRLISRVEADY